jgi:hypothetical protein
MSNPKEAFPELKELNEGLDRIENAIDDFLEKDGK